LGFIVWVVPTRPFLFERKEVEKRNERVFPFLLLYRSRPIMSHHLHVV
jgi:hypothetical protein